MTSTNITVAYGDGIGPEIMEATILILKEAGAAITVDAVEIGERAHKRGFKSGIPDECLNIIRRNKILLKAPITTPQGGEYKSVNITLRRVLGLYANVRPCVSYAPYVNTKHPKLDVVVIRENEEGLYTGIEYRQTQNTCQSLKVITGRGCEKINKFAFEYAVAGRRKKVTCFSKDNILKMTDGLFRRVFNEAAEFFPDIENDHLIVDTGSARLSSHPEDFDVIVTGNMYGDIISDIVAEISGSAGLAGSANIGDEFAMFEAVHGSAPDIAGKGIANPSGLLNAAVMMLVHIGQPNIAEKIRNAFLRTIEDGIHTADIYNEGVSYQKVNTEEFTKAVIARLGKKPEKLAPANYMYAATNISNVKVTFNRNIEEKKLIGVDVFFDWTKGDSEQLAAALLKVVENTDLKLQMIGSRGLKVWPNKGGSMPIADEFWWGRFFPLGEVKKSSHGQIIRLLDALQENGFDFIKTENLYTFNDVPSFSPAHGE
ncbi:MAG: NADP-dependent isocitrate dehydrogenase [Rickettsiales bacterium]|nr:NADP-dependent isocitrate dehydrogenase [Pseudomonadota bacterium]MDA0965716.1 NADP-dependent isocitrate dehydrogenase [Pseudomonadota bacterium]MDG4543822.1 NADP-dependent isocitrate dehydrogenase [Rickettsiales bacterium]MDG4545969.1 NADP-dependent isocitrate dehydrogenase [Rickettsiales bacterium]MDG4548215.1 NADP-dependent isocitrate dehydrogenase [Rickettsiales bacterium]